MRRGYNRCSCGNPKGARSELCAACRFTDWEDRRTAYVEMYEAGSTLAEIADAMGVTVGGAGSMLTSLRMRGLIGRRVRAWGVFSEGRGGGREIAADGPTAGLPTLGPVSSPPGRTRARAHGAPVRGGILAHNETRGTDGED